jgi:hypothetical protein
MGRKMAEKIKSTGVRSYLCKKKPVKIKHEADGDLD